MKTIGDCRFEICDGGNRVLPLIALLLVLNGCSAPYDIHLSDDRSASHGPLFFFGWADPALIPGTRLVDAPSGSRVVLWNEAGLEAIVDLGDSCAVLVREGGGARAPTELELSVIAAVFSNWPLAPSTRIGEYAGERRLDRRFPSHVRNYFDGLDAAARVEFALGDAPAGWLALGGRSYALGWAALKAPASALDRIIDAATALEGRNRVDVLLSLIERRDLDSRRLVRIARAGAAVQAARHAGADEAVCLAAVEEIAKQPLSSSRKSDLLDVLDSPGVTARVRERILAVPLSYPEDREAVRVKATK